MIQFFRIGKIITSHGIKGEVKIFSTTDDKKRYDNLKSVYLTKNPDFAKGDFDYSLEIVSVKYVNDNPIIKFRNIDTIENATKLIGYSLYINRNEAIKLKENEYYMADLVGSLCYMDTKKIGLVKDVMSTKSNGILCVDYCNKEILVPMVYDFVEKIDIENKIIHLKTLEGLL